MHRPGHWKSGIKMAACHDHLSYSGSAGYPSEEACRLIPARSYRTVYPFPAGASPIKRTRPPPQKLHGRLGMLPGVRSGMDLVMVRVRTRHQLRCLRMVHNRFGALHAR